jgi:hypothetical protein
VGGAPGAKTRVPINLLAQLKGLNYAASGRLGGRSATRVTGGRAGATQSLPPHAPQDAWCPSGLELHFGFCWRVRVRTGASAPRPPTQRSPQRAGRPGVGPCGYTHIVIVVLGAVNLCLPPARRQVSSAGARGTPNGGADSRLSRIPGETAGCRIAATARSQRSVHNPKPLAAGLDITDEKIPCLRRKLLPLCIVQPGAVAPCEHGVKSKGDPVILILITIYCPVDRRLPTSESGSVCAHPRSGARECVVTVFPARRAATRRAFRGSGIVTAGWSISAPTSAAFSRALVVASATFDQAPGCRSGRVLGQASECPASAMGRPWAEGHLEVALRAAARQ